MGAAEFSSISLVKNTGMESIKRHFSPVGYSAKIQNIPTQIAKRLGQTKFLISADKTSTGT